MIQAFKKVKFQALVCLIAMIVNFVVCWLLVIYMDYGVKGAAIATSTAYFTMFALAIAFSYYDPMLRRSQLNFSW